MTKEEIAVGQRVRSLRDFSSVPHGTEGVVDEDYGTGIMIAWDLPNHPVPKNYDKWDGRSCISTGLLRDGFNKERELIYLEIVE